MPNVFEPVGLFGFLTFVAISLLLAKIGSAWIDARYLEEWSILSYPASCNMRSKWREPLIVLGLMLLFFFASEDAPLVFLAKFVLVYFLLLFTCTDFEQQVIFDRMLFPFSLFALAFVFILDLSLLPSLLAAFSGGILFFILAVVTGGGIGGGDIKLIFSLGLWFGFSGLKTIIILGCILGGIVALCIMLVRKKKRGEYLAYGPYFCGAAIYLCLV